MATTKHALRDVTAGDVGFIFSSWLRSLGGSRTRSDKEAGYYEAQKEVVSRLVARCQVVIACAPEGYVCECHPGQPEQHIYGYGVGEVGAGNVATAHWIYVRDAERGKGIANSILRTLRKRAGINLVITSCTRPWIREKATQHGWRVAEFAPLYETIEELRKENAA